MNKLIQFKNIVKEFDGQIVLKGINLDIYENEFVTLLGPSGCGKTTLLRILGGFLRQNEGQVIFDNEDISDIPPYKRELNTVFQKYALFPHMNVYDNIAFGLSNVKEPMPKVDFEAKNAARLAEILQKPDEVVKVLEECRDKNGKLDEKKAHLKLIDAFTISLFTAKKLFAYHVESGKDLSGEITALQAKAEGARKSAQAGGGELNENFELVKNGQVVTEVRKMTKEEIDLTVRRVSRIVKIGMFMDRYPAELSGGQQQRVAIARTLAPEPSVLFMDEPLSNLDAKLRLEMRYELQRLHLETGSTFVYVTHDQMEAMTLATQICLIDNGVLQQYDAPLTVYHQPSNLFVADFVGNPSINFVEASGEQQEDGSVALTLFRNRRARFRPARPLDLKSWFQARDREAQERAELRRKQAADKNYVEKGNKDEVFRYHIAKVVEEDDSLQEEPVLTNQDLVLGVRPEFLDIEDSGSLDGEIYGAMPTGMESTIKVRVDDFLLTGVVFGSTLFSLGAKVRLNISSDNIMLFDRQSGRCITQGSLEFLQV